MKDIIDRGREGAARMGEYRGPQAERLPAQLEQYLAFIKRLPREVIDADAADGIKKTVELRPLLLSNSRVFDIVHDLAPSALMVYAKQGGVRTFGMLSPNYDEKGQKRLASIKVIPLQTAYPLTSDLKPDARMATMLTGAVNAEAKGVGGHGGRVLDDFEHKATILGAVSLGNPAIAIRHQNHGVRKASSVARGLTNGQLGNLYTPDSTLSEFTGYGKPLVFEKGSVTEADIIYFPDSFHVSEAFGSHYTDASRIMLGAGMQALFDRKGLEAASEISSLSMSVSAVPREAVY